MQSFSKNEKGLAVVEATMLLPFCIIMVLALYYASIFLCQKANLQANLEDALIYYKNAESDTYVNAKVQMDYTGGQGMVSADGGGYQKPENLFPYRFFGMTFKEKEVESFFRSMCGHMFFDTGDNVEFVAEKTNYVVYKTIKARAEQTVTPAISLSMLGVENKIMISVTGEVVITDGEDFIRNVDFIIDIVEDTEIGKKATEMVDQAVDLYNKFKKHFDIE